VARSLRSSTSTLGHVISTVICLASNQMKFTLRDALFLIAIVALGISFALHRSDVKNDFYRHQLRTEHSIARLKFSNAMGLVDENFRRAGLGFLPNKTDFKETVYSGTFEYEYNWWNNTDSPVENEMLVDLIRPVSERFSGLDGRFIWDSETTPTLKTLFSTKDLETGKIRFRVTYTIPSSADNNAMIRTRIPAGL